MKFLNYCNLIPAEQLKLYVSYKMLSKKNR